MKSTGIVRKVDELGRVVIPIELRRTLGIDEKDALEIYTDNEKIVLKKYEPSLHFLQQRRRCTELQRKTGLHRMREENGGKPGSGQRHYLSWCE